MYTNKSMANLPHALTMQQYSFPMMVLALLICPSFAILADMAPYEAVIGNITVCVNQPPWFHTNITTYTSHGRTLVRGVIVTKQILKDPKFRMKIQYMESGKGEPMDIKDLSCHNILVRTVLRATGLRYNTQKCTLNPTNTEFSNLDIDAMFHAVRMTFWLGNIRMRWEITVPAAKLMCFETDIQIVKTTKNSPPAGENITSSLV